MQDVAGGARCERTVWPSQVLGSNSAAATGSAGGLCQWSARQQGPTATGAGSAGSPGAQANRTIAQHTRTVRPAQGRQEGSSGGQKKRLKQTGTWTDEELQAALALIENGSTIKAAAQQYVIPYSTLREWTYTVRTSRKHGPPAVLSPKEEQHLVDYVIAMCDMGFGLTTTALRLKVQEMRSTRWTPFRNGIPGKSWLKWWQKRHPELTLRVAEALASSSVEGLNSTNVRTFYNNLDYL